MEDKERQSLDNLTLHDSWLKGPAHESQDSSMGAQLPLQDSHTSSFPSSSCPCESMQPPTAGPADVPSEDLNFGQSLLAGIWPETSRPASKTSQHRMARSLSENDACQGCGRFITDKEKVKILVCGICADKIDWKNKLFNASRRTPQSENEDLSKIHIHIEHEIHRLLGPSAPMSPTYPNPELLPPTTPHPTTRSQIVSRWSQEASPGLSQEMPTPTAVKQTKLPARSPFSNT